MGNNNRTSKNSLKKNVRRTRKNLIGGSNKKQKEVSAMSKKEKEEIIATYQKKEKAKEEAAAKAAAKEAADRANFTNYKSRYLAKLLLNTKCVINPQIMIDYPSEHFMDTLFPGWKSDGKDFIIRNASLSVKNDVDADKYDIDTNTLEVLNIRLDKKVFNKSENEKYDDYHQPIKDRRGLKDTPES